LLGYAYVSRAASLGLEPAKDTLSQLDGLMGAADRQKAIALSRSIPTAATAPADKASKQPRMTQPKPPKIPPKPRVVSPTPKPVPVATGAWRIQLGAFAQRGGAEALYRRVAGKPALAGRGPFYIAAGNVTRLQVGPFASRAAAASACATLGTACFPVPAK
jgi:hypothetical protein